MSNATDAGTSSQAGQPRYWVHKAGEGVQSRAVVSGAPDDPGSAGLVGFNTEKHAQVAADTLNELREDGGRPNAVLGY